jgi:hypothetical protein
MDNLPVPDEIAARVRAACAHLPEAVEDQPHWPGLRWRIRGGTFADLQCQEIEGAPVSHVTFHAREELDALLGVGHPFYPGWGGGLVAMVLTDDEKTDWDEVREVLTDSYCLLAPKKLIALIPDQL